MQYLPANLGALRFYIAQALEMDAK